MESLLSFEFWFFGVLFLLAILMVWLSPGLLILHVLKIRLEAISQIALGLVVGLALWGMQAYVFGYLNVRVLTYGYVGAWALLALRNRKIIWQEVVNAVRAIFSLPRLLLLILFVGVLVQVVQMFGSGLVSTDGMSFFRVHMQDGIYHLSMIRSMVRSFPPVEPGAAGVLVQNYHYWSDLIMADLVRVFRFPVHHLFFQYLPSVISLFTALAVISVLRLWSKRKLVWLFGLFLLFFGADLGYLVAYFLHGSFSFEYPVIDNGATQFLNMPHAMAKMVFMTSLLSLAHWIKENKFKWGLITVIFTALLFGLKVYFGLYAVLGLGVVGIICALANIQLFKQFVVCGLIGGIMALAIYLPPNRNSGGLGFYPLEWPKLMLAEANLDWREWRYKYAVAGLEQKTAKIVLYDLEAIAITLLAIHGTRILGLVVTRRSWRELGSIWVAYLIIPTLIFTFLGLYTLQVSGSFNVFNFFATSLAPLALLSAFLFADLWKIKLVGPVLVTLLLALTLPRIIFETDKILVSYRDNTDVLYISKGEMAALSAIDKTYPASCVIATSLNNQIDMSTPYVSYFTNRDTYMSGQRVLETHNAPVAERFLEYKQIFAGNDGQKIVSLLKAKGICALYLNNEDELSKYFQIHVKLMFQSDVARIVDLR